MRTQSRQPRHYEQHPLPGGPVPSPAINQGLISELVYGDRQPAVFQLLLPLLLQLGTQSRWLLWLTPRQKLSRSWLLQSGLPIEKVIQLSQISPAATVEAMEKALLTGNYSAVLGWLPELTTSDRERLHIAAQQGSAYGFIMRPQQELSTPAGQFSTLKIHSSLYH